MNRPGLLSAVATLLLRAGSLPAADLILAANGLPGAEIVLSEREAAGPVLFAVEELQRYLKAMSGASFPLVKVAAFAPSAGKVRIDVTADPKAAAAVLPPPLSLDGDDRYFLRVNEAGISIVGSTPRAVLYATYDLLERLGCGWCVPGDDSIPRRSTIPIAPFELDTSPAFRYRMLLDFPLASVAQSLAIVDWLAKNRMNWVHPCTNAMGEPKAWYERRDRVVPEIQRRGLQVIFGGHTMHTWLPPELFTEHPDWFAYNDAERKPPTLCVANSDMTAELIRNLQRFLDRCPEVEVVDLWHPDGDVFCHCAACTQGLVPAEAMGKVPAGRPLDAVRAAYVMSYIQFMNRVAAAIEKSHPRVMVSPLIYGPADHAMPDGCPAPADNLLVGLAHISRDSYRPLAGETASARNQRYLGNDLTWMARSKHHYIYEYYNGWVAPYIYPGAQVIVRDLQILRELGSQGASSDMYGYSPCNMYVGARALWSPSISWEAAVRDFHERYYADLGREMADNWVGVEKGVRGKDGYQSGGALNDPARRAASGEFFNQIRPRQIEFHEQLIARAQDPQIKARLARALKPWKAWSAEARWWAFPPFADPK